jgi:hypothetical protein
MIGFEVDLNGTRLCTASAGETGVLSAIVTWVQRSAPGVPEPSELSLAVGGLAKGTQLEWVSQRKLAVGDEVLVKIVETATPDPPVHTRTVDRAADEADERKYYERLRLKYEGK